MVGVVVGFSLLTLTNWAVLWVVWRRHVAIEARMAEPGLVNTELIRRLAASYGAAKAMLEACPPSDMFGPCAGRRRVLAGAVAAVDEFGPQDAAPHRG
jgi:hypothetical protein